MSKKKKKNIARLQQKRQQLYSNQVSSNPEQPAVTVEPHDFKTDLHRTLAGSLCIVAFLIAIVVINQQQSVVFDLGQQLYQFLKLN